jgi:hypothetical protein
MKTSTQLTGWLSGRLPDGWFAGAPEVVVDRDEITVVGTLPAPDAGDSDPRAAESGRIGRFREDTRDERIRIAREAEHDDGRTIAWGAACGETRKMFTNQSVPVMTRLRQPERRILDTLVAAGVARSRADALAWCVRLVGTHESDWIEQLRAALVAVESARESGPAA